MYDLNYPPIFQSESEYVNNAGFTPKGVIYIKAPEIWEQANYGNGNVIAVIDSGCDVNHKNLRNNIIGAFNFTNDDEGDTYNVTDYIGHGTHVAGIIGAEFHDKGIIGIAPKCKLLILKVIDQHGKSSYENLIQAIQYAINWRGAYNQKISIINISMGGKRENPNLHAVIKQAYQQGICTICASGNYGDGDDKTDEILYPAFYKEVFEIGSAKNPFLSSKFSNSNVNIDFLAPGEDIISTYPSNQYKKLKGTSMAAPHASGAIALILNLINKDESHLIPPRVYNYLLQSSLKPIDNKINIVGNGFITLI